jgi:hypothetical protein
VTAKLDAIRRLGFAATLVLAAAAQAVEDLPPPPPAPDTRAPAANRGAPVDCKNCGAVRSIRAVERERAAGREISPYMTSEQYLDTRRYSEPRVGPVFGMTFGAGQQTRTFVGAAGSSTMRQRILEIVYEVTVRFDDGRYGLVEMSDASGFRVGDRVRVVDNQLQLLPRE